MPLCNQSIIKINQNVWEVKGKAENFQKIFLTRSNVIVVIIFCIILQILVKVPEEVVIHTPSSNMRSRVI